MDEYQAFFPYTPAAMSYVQSSERTFASLITPGEFSDRVLKRSVRRVANAANTNASLTLDEPDSLEAELLSYVMARVLVSCLRDPLLIQKYASAEAREAFNRLMCADERSQHNYVTRLLNDFDIEASVENSAFKLRFTDLIRYTARLRGPQWRLVNRLNRGHVTLTKNEIIQLLAEAVRSKVLSGLPLRLSGEKCKALAFYISPLKRVLSLTSYRRPDSENVILEACPPCIKALLFSVKGGQNLAHPARFALTSFLANIGMKTDKIVQVYETSPDFDYELTRYQVDHITGTSGKDYAPPGCSTMETYGNCVESDGLCKRISHPLSYYRARTKHREDK